MFCRDFKGFLRRRIDKIDLRFNEIHRFYINVYMARNQQSGKADLNRRPLGPEPSALPPALLPVRRFFRREKNTHSLEWVVTGATGLEPAISGVTGQRDNQLRYAPVI